MHFLNLSQKLQSLELRHIYNYDSFDFNLGTEQQSLNNIFSLNELMKFSNFDHELFQISS
jgi:hypothetical protein